MRRRRGADLDERLDRSRSRRQRRPTSEDGRRRTRLAELSPRRVELLLEDGDLLVTLTERFERASREQLVIVDGRRRRSVTWNGDGGCDGRLEARVDRLERALEELDLLVARLELRVEVGDLHNEGHQREYKKTREVGSDAP